MSAASREQIADALLARLKLATLPLSVNGALQFVTADRRLQMYDSVPAGDQPALFQVEHDEQYEQPGRGIPPKRILSISIFCYARAEIGATLGATIVNSMLAAIEAALAPDDPPGTACTLGGLVSWVRIEGRVFKDPGDLDQQALLIVPLRVMWP